MSRAGASFQLRSEIAALKGAGCLIWGLAGCAMSLAVVVLLLSPCVLLYHYVFDEVALAQRVATNQAVANATVTNVTSRQCQEVDEGQRYVWVEKDAVYTFQYQGKKYGATQRDTGLSQGQVFPLYFLADSPGDTSYHLTWSARAGAEEWQNCKARWLWRYPIMAVLVLCVGRLSLLASRRLKVLSWDLERSLAFISRPRQVVARVTLKPRPRP